MNQVKKLGRIGYEDLMRELEVIERQILIQDSGIAMDLMVLETKIRERFQIFDTQVRLLDSEAASQMEFGGEEWSMESVEGLIPRDLPSFPTIEEIQLSRKRKRLIKTVGMAAGLAVFTALG